MCSCFKGPFDLPYSFLLFLAISFWYRNPDYRSNPVKFPEESGIRNTALKALNTIRIIPYILRASGIKELLSWSVGAQQNLLEDSIARVRHVAGDSVVFEEYLWYLRLPVAEHKNNIAVTDLSSSVHLCVRGQHLYWRARVLVNVREHQVQLLYVITVWELNEGPSTVVT
jgi:hypothetical protein